jgi:hypothetical protein
MEEVGHVKPHKSGSRARALGIAALSGCAAWVAAPAVHAQSEDPGVAVDVPPDDQYSETDPAALSDFRPALDPYGTWVDDPSYGTAWTPDPNAVGAGFEPYDTNGGWDYEAGDYTWVSDYAWGWVCFHYGRWVFGGGRWLWIPGRQYAGAWVTWRVGEASLGMLGWSPAPPSWGWVGGSAFALGAPPPEPWAFAPYGDLFGPSLSSHVTFGDIALPLVARTQPYVRSAPAQQTQQTQQTQLWVHGPAPQTLGIDVSRIPHVGPSANELRARQFAHPSSAVPLGARAPSLHFVRTRSPLGSSRAPSGPPRPPPPRGRR